MIRFLYWLKVSFALKHLHSIETLASQALAHMEITTHQEFVTILKEKDKYKKIKENLRNVNEKLEEINKIMRLISGVIANFCNC